MRPAITITTSDPHLCFVLQPARRFVPVDVQLLIDESGNDGT
jgi:hypothetical protein